VAAITVAQIGEIVCPSSDIVINTLRHAVTISAILVFSLIRDRELDLIENFSIKLDCTLHLIEDFMKDETEEADNVDA
jgi:hypothetical protein